MPPHLTIIQSMQVGFLQFKLLENKLVMRC